MENPPPKEFTMALPSVAIEPTTLVLLDPTNPGGESALDDLSDIDTHVTLVVLLWDEAGAALRDYAQSENIDLSSAGRLYLEQVAASLQLDRASISYEVVNGSRPALELAMLQHTLVTRRVLLPRTERDRPNAHPTVTRLLNIVAPNASPSRLRATPLGRRTPEREIRRIDGIGTLIHLDPGTCLARQGANPGGACVLVEGSAEVTRDGSHVATLGAGDFVGEISLIAGTRCNADVVTTENTIIVEFTPQEFTRVLDECPTVAKYLLQASVQRLLAA